MKIKKLNHINLIIIMVDIVLLWLDIKKVGMIFFRATNPFDNNEYVPCMVSGYPVEDYQHYNIIYNW